MWRRLVYFVFDLLHRDGRNLMPLPLADRKSGLATLLERGDGAIRNGDHQISQDPAFHKQDCALEGIVSKRLDARTAQAITGSNSKPNASTAMNLQNYYHRAAAVGPSAPMKLIRYGFHTAA